jgi:transcriptional regulator with XRE-family HTH domain
MPYRCRSSISARADVVIGMASVRGDVGQYASPWSFLMNDEYRTPILAFQAPAHLPRDRSVPPTDVHFDYFGLQLHHRLPSNGSEFVREIAAAVLRAASSATPVDNEFWSLAFPGRRNTISVGTLQITYVTLQRPRQGPPDLALLTMPDDMPALQIVFTTRRAFVPAALPQFQGGPELHRPQLGTVPVMERGVSIPLGAARPRLALPVSTRELPHVEAYQRLREAFRITDDELADVVGVGRTTPYKWSREGASPKPTTLRLILRLDAIVRGLLASRERTSFDEWLLLGDPSPIALLRRHDFDRFERRAHAAIFARPAVRTVGYDLEGPALPQRAVPPLSVARRRAKVSLPKRDR